MKRYRTLIIVVSLVVFLPTFLFLLAWVNLPKIAQYGVQQFTPYTLEYEMLDVSLFEGVVQSSHLRLQTAQSSDAIHIKDLSLHISLRDLLIGRVMVNNLSLDGIYIDLDIVQESVLLGGVPPTEEKSESSPKERTPTPLNMEIKNVQIQNMDLDIKYNQTQIDTQIHKFTLDQMSLLHPNRVSQILLDTSLWEQEISLKATTHPLALDKTSEIALTFSNVNLEIIRNKLSSIAPNLPTLKGNISGNYRIETSVDGKNLPLKITGKMTATDFEYSDQRNLVETRFDSLRIDKVNYSSNALQDDQTLNLKANLQGLSFIKTDSQTIDLKLVDISNVEVHKNAKSLTAKLSSDVQQLKIKQNDGSGVFIKSISLDKINYEQNTMRVLRGKKLDFLNLYLLSSKQNARGTSDIKLRDLNLTEKSSPEKSSDRIINLDTKIGSFGSLSLSRKQDPPESETTVKVRSLNLTDFSGFLEDQLGYRVKSGQLDADLKSRVSQDDSIKGNLKLVLNRLDLDDENTKGKDLKKKNGVPLSTSLNLIKDNQGQIKLEFPIDGKASDPSFSPRVILTEKLGDIMMDELTKAVGTAVVTTYLPALASSVTLNPAVAYRLVKSGVDFATKLRFEPITFKKGQSALEVESRKQLDKIATVLGQKEDVSLSFCPVANVYEKISLETKVDEQVRNETLKLAKKRLDNISHYLIKNKGLRPFQVVTCQPKISESEESFERGKVEVSF